MSKDRRFSTAIHILTVLAFGAPDLVSSQSISLGLRTNPALVRRVLTKLSESGLVVSTKGPGGGSCLAKPADEISLRDVYMAVREGPIFGSFDKDPYSGCKVSRNIGGVLTNVYSELEETLMAGMDEVTIARILESVG